LNCLTRFFTIFCVSSGTAIWRRSTRPHEQSDTSRRWSQPRTRNERRRIRPRLVGWGHDETKVGGFCYLCEPCGGDATVRAAAAAAGVRGKDRLLLWRRDNPSNVVGFICSKKMWWASRLARDWCCKVCGTQEIAIQQQPFLCGPILWHRRPVLLCCA
jgi:hypothetical protein